MKDTQMPQSIVQKNYNVSQQIQFDMSSSKDQIAFINPESKELQIISKFGQIIKQAPFLQQVIQISFSPCTYYLSVLTENYLFIARPQKKQLKFEQIDLEGLNACVQNWSHNSVLAVGTKTGEIVFYYPQNSKKIVTVGKHSSQITNLSWNHNNLLLSTSKKEKITVSTEDSQTHESSQSQGINFQQDISQLKWINLKKVRDKKRSSVLLDNLKSDNIFIAITQDRKSLLIFDIQSKQKPLKAEFNLNYGIIIDFEYLSTGEIIVAFSKGCIIKISLLNDNLQEEIDNEKIFINHFSQLIVQEKNDKIYVVGDQEMKVFNVRKFKEYREYYRKCYNQNEQLQISQNGQIGVIVNNRGIFEILMFYYDSQPKLNEQFLVHQNSCNELQIFMYQQDNLKLHQFNVINEDGFEIQGYELHQDTVFVFFENTYKLYQLKEQIECVQQGELKEDIQLVLTNKDGYVIFCQNQILILNKNTQKEVHIKQKKVFEKEKTQIDENFIYQLENDTFVVYDLYCFKELFKTSLDLNATKMFYNSDNFYFIFQNNDNQIIYYNLQDQKKIHIENFQADIKNIFFQSQQNNNFCILDNQHRLFTVLVNQNNYQQDLSIQLVLESIDYEQYKDRSGQICQTYLQKEFVPMIYKDGYLICLIKDQMLHKQFLASHSFLMDMQDTQNKQRSNEEIDTDNSLQIQEDTIEQQFFQSLELKMFDFAYIISSKMKNKTQVLENLAKESLKNFDFQTAKKCYQKLQQYNMFNLIQFIENKSNKREQQGYIATIMNEYEIAKQYFINSDNQKLAIQLMQQNQQFQEALQIAQQYNLQDEISEINIQIAQQELLKGNFIKAMQFYESALKNTTNNQIQQRAYFGQIKVSLEQKNTLKIQQLLNKIKNKDYLEEIAEICYKNQLFEIGVQIYKKVQNIEKIVEGLLNVCKIDQTKIIELSQFVENNLEQINDKSLLLKIGKFFEKSENKNLSEKIYIQSGDNVSLIKFYLFSAQNPDKAEQIFEEYCKDSQTAASHLADYFVQIEKNKKKSIQYYIQAGKRIEAFNKARSEQLIDVYCQYIQKVEQKEALVIAQYYEDIKDYCKSGKYYEECNQLEKSLVNYIKGKDYQAAIDLVMKLKSEELFEFLVQIFAGNTSIYEDEEIENMEIVEPMYLFKLYIAFDRIENANEIALVIIEKEAEEGNYKIAKEKAFEMKNLIQEKHQEKLSYELKNKYLIYHSYFLAKTFIKLEKNTKAAYLLNRVCSYINYFPKHKVQILTSAVIQCTKAKLKGFAHFWAVTLCKPIYRSQIQPKLKEKIEKIALKGAQQKNQNDSVESKCIYCDAILSSSYDLSCHNCKNELPLCISSGISIENNQHLGQVMQCQNCKGITYQYELQDMLSVQNQCPQCQTEYDLNLFKNIDIENLTSLSNQFQFNKQR